MRPKEEEKKSIVQIDLETCPIHSLCFGLFDDYSVRGFNLSFVLVTAFHQISNSIVTIIHK